jgi:hypothetical protein
MTGSRGSALPGWVVPSVTEVDQVSCLAWSQYDTPRGNRAQACGIVSALRWVSGQTLVGPVTGRHDQPVTAAVATAECWAAKALTEGCRSEQQLQQACAELGVAYWPPNIELIDPEEAHGVYQTLSWLLGWAQGYRGGCVSPLPPPRHPQQDSTVTTDQPDAQAISNPGSVPHLLQQRSTTPQRSTPSAPSPAGRST